MSYSQESISDDFCYWSPWIVTNHGVDFRYTSKKEPNNGNYQTWFEFVRTDAVNMRNEDKLYAHIELTVVGYPEKIYKSIRATGSGSEKVKLYFGNFPLTTCNGIRYSCKIGFSKYSNASSVF